jgi:hypothetical protein
VARIERARLPEELVFAHPCFATIPGGIVEQALETHAEEVRFACVAQLLWVRLAGGVSEADLLFDLEDAMEDLLTNRPAASMQDLTSPPRSLPVRPQRPIQGTEHARR